MIIEVRPEKTCFLHLCMFEIKGADQLRGYRAADQRI